MTALQGVTLLLLVLLCAAGVFVPPRWSSTVLILCALLLAFLYLCSGGIPD